MSDVFGWQEQGDGKLFCSLWIEEGRIKDTEERQWRTAFRDHRRAIWISCQADHQL